MFYVVWDYGSCNDGSHNSGFREHEFQADALDTYAEHYWPAKAEDGTCILIGGETINVAEPPKPRPERHRKPVTETDKLIADSLNQLGAGSIEQTARELAQTRRVIDLLKKNRIKPAS